MDGFKRPGRPSPPRPTAPQSPVRLSQPSVRPQAPRATPVAQARPPVQPIAEPPLPPIDPLPEPTKKPKRTSRTKNVLIVLAGIVLFIAAAVAITLVWYNTSIQPRNSSDQKIIKLEIKDKMSLSAVADSLEQKGVIRSAAAFMIYARLHQQQDIKAGTCNLTPAESVSVILEKLTIGCHDFKVVTFYPGATIETSLYAKTHATETNQQFVDFSIRQSLRTAGYDTAEIDAALTATYTSPLFADKPAGTGFEGYIFGETYYVDEDATAQEVLQTAFDHMYSIVKKNDLVTKFKAKGLTLYQGITLASIVEKELDCEGKPTEERKQRCYGYQQHIASVFYNRMDEGMTLGSDVTFIYAADRLGVSPSVDVDSPYNLRSHTGLTPGPIASPGELALMAVANPTPSSDLFFLAGDDGLIYFAPDNAGHEQNIRQHCQQGCGGAV